MLKRNKLPREQKQAPIIHQHTQYNDQPRSQILSPNPPSNRIERKQREDLSSAKSSSLNAKLVRKNFQNMPERLRNAQGGEKNQQNPYLVNIDYYPNLKQQAKSPKIDRVPLHFSQKREGKMLISSFESAPNLPVGEDSRQLQPRQKRQQQQMSTQLSKQSDDCDNFKEVRFKSQLQQPQKACLKKKKVRSPSILKNGSRNILNGSIISQKSRERSCSAASGRERSSYMRTSNENNTNKIIKQKYKSILNKLQAQSKTGACGRGNRFSGAVYSVDHKKVPSAYKYRDQIFPPVYSSIFATKIGRQKVGEELTWMRISDLFSDRQICIIGPSQSLQISRTIDSYASDPFISVLNSLQGSPQLLNHIFQNQQINPYGIYLLNIYQQNTWKYIIIDDYIPVSKTQDKFTPAFVNVNSQGAIPIWPLLIEKAYANYYARYEALQHGNLVDLAEQLSGTPSRRILLKNQGVRKGEKMSEGEMQHSLKRLKNQARNGQVIMIGQLLGDKGYISIVYSSKDKSLFYNDPNNSFKRRVITFDTLSDLCRAVNIISPLKYDSCSLAVIRKNRTSITKPRNDSLFDLQIPSIRTFTVAQPSQFMISLRQREKRLFHLKPEIGEYIWCRFILLQKEYGQNGFRWIDGEYNCCKSINFCCFLEAGQYWLLVQPEWRASSASQIWIQIHGRPTQPQRHIFSHQQRAIQHACLDLAQRHGQLNQINKFICSYNYITEKVGLIIESIINERINGEVTVMRSIKGLKCKVQILPVNREFYEEVLLENGLKGFKLNEEIELDIPKKQQFTVVLKLKGGIDRKFFKSFDFGC